MYIAANINLKSEPVMLKRFRVEEGSDNDVVVVPADVIREATEAVFRICGMTVRMKSRILDSYY